MPSDSRRIPVPENSLNPRLFISHEKKKQVISEDHYSCSSDEDKPQPVFLKAGVIEQAHGSAYVEMNNTKAICAVYGPRDIGRRDDYRMDGVVKCELKFAPFSCNERRSHILDDEEVEYSQVLSQALEPAIMKDKFPKSQVDVYVTVLQNDGSALAAGIIAASLALVDASIEMFDVVTAFSLKQTNKGQSHDATLSGEFCSSVRNAEMMNHSSLTVSLLPLVNQLSAVLSNEVVDCEMLADAVHKCTSGAQDIYPILRDASVLSYKGGPRNGN